MRPKAWLLPIGFLLLIFPPTLSGEPLLDAAFEEFWQAKTPRQEAQAIKTIRALDPDFETVHRRLTAGRTYSAKVKTGRLLRTRTGLFHYTVLVPESYDPARRYPVRVVLHGGVARPAFRRDGSWWRHYEKMAHPDRILVFPASWDRAMWWQANQVENLAGILKELRRDYNFDENRAHLLGVSDGGTGVYFQAFRAPTPWASFLSLIGHPGVLTSPSVGTEGQLYVPNLRNRPFLAINGSHDRLYPSRRVLPFMDLFREQGVDLEFVDRKNSGHTVSWWPEEASRIDRFIEAHPRNPLPDRLTWETERTDRDHRIHWLLIDELGKVSGESRLDDPNPLASSRRVFPRDKPSGRVDLERRGNQISVRTRGVRRYSLLLSPDQFDFGQPIVVTTNGRESFRRLVSPDVETLLEWGMRDQDRTMLFGARLEIEVATRISPRKSTR